MTLNYLNCDSGSEQLEVNFLTYYRTNNIYINASAPYKHQQNFIECFVGAIKNGVRVALLYNKAPFYLWYHAMVYYIHTYNQVPRRNETRSKDEHFYGIKPDVSINVPFYAVGYAHNPKENRKDKVYSPLAYKCRFIGYAIDVNWTNTPQISKANEISNNSAQHFSEPIKRTRELHGRACCVLCMDVRMWIRNSGSANL